MGHQVWKPPILYNYMDPLGLGSRAFWMLRVKVLWVSGWQLVYTDYTKATQGCLESRA